MDVQVAGRQRRHPLQNGATDMKPIKTFERWASLMLCLATLTACGKDPLPLPAGVNPNATPRIIVKGKPDHCTLEINGKIFNRYTISVADFVEVLGPYNLKRDNGDFYGYHWDRYGIYVSEINYSPPPSVPRRRCPVLRSTRWSPNAPCSTPTARTVSRCSATGATRRTTPAASA